MRAALPCGGAGAVLVNVPGTRRRVEMAQLACASPQCECRSAPWDMVPSLWPARGLGSGRGTPVPLRGILQGIIQCVLSPAKTAFQTDGCLDTSFIEAS